MDNYKFSNSTSSSDEIKFNSTSSSDELKLNSDNQTRYGYSNNVNHTTSSSGDRFSNLNHSTTNSFDNKEVDETKYNLILVLAGLAGRLGMHRLVTGKVISGIIMMLTTFIYTIMFLVMFLQVIRDTSIDEYTDEQYMVVGLVFIVIILMYLSNSIWLAIDRLMIMTGNFKDSRTKKNIASGKPFFSVWSNIFVLLNSIVKTILIVVCIFWIFVYSDSENETFNDYINEEGSIANEDLLSECLFNVYGIEKSEDVDVLNVFEQFFTSQGYKSDDMVEDYMPLYYKDAGDYTYLFNINTTRSDVSCILGVSKDKGENYLDVSSYIYEDEATIYYLTDNSYVTGNYNIKSETFELEYIKDVNSFETEPYDENIDELNIMDEINKAVELYIEEVNALRKAFEKQKI